MAALLGGITIEEYEQLPAALARGHELVNGQLTNVSGNFAHNEFRDVLVVVLRPYVRDHKLGRLISGQAFRFDEQTACAPDVSFFGPEKRFDGRLRVQPFIPDLAIEIASIDDKFEALLSRVLYYRENGVKEIYLFSIDTRQVFRYSDDPPTILTESQDFRPDQIPGFSIRIADLLAMI
jgi:Uma2 family endonuclease